MSFFIGLALVAAGAGVVWSGVYLGSVASVGGSWEGTPTTMLASTPPLQLIAQRVCTFARSLSAPASQSWSQTCISPVEVKIDPIGDWGGFIKGSMQLAFASDPSPFSASSALSGALLGRRIFMTSRFANVASNGVSLIVNVDGTTDGDVIVGTLKETIVPDQGTGYIVSSPISLNRAQVVPSSTPVDGAGAAHLTRGSAHRIAASPWVNRPSRPATIRLPLGVERFGNVSIHDIILETRQIDRVRQLNFCHGVGDVSIDVSGYGPGCVNEKRPRIGTQGDGTQLLILPVNSGSSRGVFYALLYVLKKAPVFLGVLPGNGTGHLSVGIMKGFIFEKWPNGGGGTNTVKFSLYEDGSVRKINVVQISSK